MAALLIAVFSVPANCQDLHVYYNLFNDTITYMKGGKPVNKLRIRKGQEVQVHLTEFNPFINNIDLKVEEKTDDSGSGLMGVGGMTGFMGMPGLGNIFPGAEGMLGGGLPLFDEPLMVVNDSTISFKNIMNLFKKESRGGLQKKAEEGEQAMKDIEAIMKEATAIYNQLAAYEKAVQVSRIALASVDMYRLNPNLTPSSIKATCQEYYDAIYLKSHDNRMSLNDLLAWQNLPAQYELNVARLKSKQSELGAKVSVLEKVTSELTSNQVEDEDEVFNQYTRNMIDAQKKARSVRDQLKEIVAKAAPPTNLPNTQEMAQLQMKLAEVISNDFTYNTTIKPSADQVNLDIKLLKIQMGADSTEPVLIKERNLKMEVRGGLKVNASAGVSFGQFFEPSQSFAVNNGVIVGDNEGTFTPSLTSFLHFHGYRGPKATVGGSLGLGFPLLSSGDSQSVEFFVGPSLILGSSQRLVLSTGLMGGRAQRLAKGYQVGDAFDTDLGDIPTHGKYEIGLFLGASFSLGK